LQKYTALHREQRLSDSYDAAQFKHFFGGFGTNPRGSSSTEGGASPAPGAGAGPPPPSPLIENDGRPTKRKSAHQYQPGSSAARAANRIAIDARRVVPLGIFS
jgi:hypothetical protein